MKRLLLPILLLCLAGRPDAGRQEHPAAPAYEPDKTTMAVLPIANKADEFSAKFKAKIQGAAQKALVERFQKRGFPVLEMSSVEKALTEAKFDVGDRENWNAAHLQPIGKQLHCRLILLCAITDAHMKTNETLFSIGGGSREGIANVRAFLVDVETGTDLLKGTHAEGKSSGGAFGDFDRGMDRQARAVVLGLDRALKAFLASYPVVEKKEKGTSN